MSCKKSQKIIKYIYKHSCLVRKVKKSLNTFTNTHVLLGKSAIHVMVIFTQQTRDKIMNTLYLKGVFHEHWSVLIVRMGKIGANLLLPKALKSCTSAKNRPIWSHCSATKAELDLVSFCTNETVIKFFLNWTIPCLFFFILAIELTENRSDRCEDTNCASLVSEATVPQRSPKHWWWLKKAIFLLKCCYKDNFYLFVSICSNRNRIKVTTKIPNSIKRGSNRGKGWKK